MAKFSGKIGYAVTTEVKPGVWKPSITEVPATGDVIDNASMNVPSTDSTNDNLNLNIKISIIADPFANNNFQKMKYAEYLGCLWEIKSVKPSYPRLVLTIGGVYNGK